MFASGALPARLPADLLGRRPDIVAARLRVEAAFANADSTRAQFYPDVNLVALGGVFALTPASLFSRDALAGSIGPAISLPIFDRGRLKAKLGADVAQADVAIGLYNKTVDDALGKVAQFVTSLQTSQTLVAQQQDAVAAAQKIVEIATDRHRRGVLMQKDVDVADLTLIDERAQMIALLGRQRSLRIEPSARWAAGSMQARRLRRCRPRIGRVAGRASEALRLPRRPWPLRPHRPRPDRWRRRRPMCVRRAWLCQRSSLHRMRAHATRRRGTYAGRRRDTSQHRRSRAHGSGESGAGPSVMPPIPCSSTIV